MQGKSIFIVVVGIFFIVQAILISSFAFTAPPPNKAPSITTENVGWQLTNAMVVDMGKTVTIKEGVIVTGYKVEALAKAIGNAPLIDGKFQMTMSIFSPNMDMPGQIANKWYVSGAWTIIDLKAILLGKKWHSPELVRGTLLSELSFNPATSSGSIDAIVRLPMLPAVGLWTVGDGIFSGNEKFEGIISLTIDRWSATMMGTGGLP